MKRNLYYNCCPITAADAATRDNVRMLCRYGEIFNGRRIVVIRTGPGMVDPEEVENTFAQHGFRDVDFRHLSNDPVLHEVANFIETLESLHSLDEKEATFYAHTKGVRVSDPTDMRAVSIRQWRNRMYHECLHDTGRIDALLSEYATAGCFLEPGTVASKKTWTKWMYCGTFFWFNHAALFSKDNWRFIGPNPDRFATENYLGIHIDREKAFCLYATRHASGALYHGAVIDVRCPRCNRIFGVQLRKLNRGLVSCCRRLVKPQPFYYRELGSLAPKKVGSRL